MLDKQPSLPSSSLRLNNLTTTVGDSCSLQSDIALVNPNTHTCPVFRTTADAELTKRIFKHVPIFMAQKVDSQSQAWRLTVRQNFFSHTSDSALFHSAKQLIDAGATRA